MGLDNSIEVKRNAYTNSIPELKRFEEIWDTKREYDFTIADFRKCYNVRHMVFNAIKHAYDNDISAPLSIDDVGNIIKGLQSFNSRNWQERGGSIWHWDEYKDHVKQSIKNLQLLVKLMKKYDLEVYFYDSY